MRLMMLFGEKNSSHIARTQKEVADTTQVLKKVLYKF